MACHNKNNLPGLASGVRKSAIRLLPFLALMYALAFIDRANVGFAKIAYQADTGISDAAFAFGAGIFFVGYALFEVPSNLILQKIGAKVWISRIMVTWGLISAAMMFAESEELFYLLRFLLGASEAGFMPGIILYLTYWFPEKERTRALGLFYFGVPLAMMIGSPLSGLLLASSNPFGLTNWQWMFVVEGLAASVVGVIAFFYLDNRPKDAKWLTVEERNALTAAIEIEEMSKTSSAHSSVFAVLKNKRVLTFIAIYFCIQIANAPLAFYLPSKLAATMGNGLDTAVGILLMIPWLCTIVVMRIATIYADRHDNHLGVASCLLAIGIAAFACISFTTTLVTTLVAFCIAIPGLVACQPVFWSLPTRYLGGKRAAAGIAFIISFGNLGGFISPQIKAHVDALTGSAAAGFQVIAILSSMSILLLLSLRSKASPTHTPSPAN